MAKGEGAMIGEMVETIEIQTRSYTQTAYGEEIVTWTTVATVWAAVENNRRATEWERYLASTGKERQRTHHKFTIYYDPAFTVTPEDNRIRWNTNAWDVEQVVDPDGRKQWLEIHVRAIK